MSERVVQEKKRERERRGEKRTAYRRPCVCACTYVCAFGCVLSDRESVGVWLPDVARFPKPEIDGAIIVRGPTHTSIESGERKRETLMVRVS